MTGLMQDVKLAFRLFIRSPALTLVVIITLGLGVGASTAISSFVSGVLLEPLAYPDPEQLVMVCETHPSRPDRWCGASPANWRDWKRSSTSFENLGLARSWHFSVQYGESGGGVSGGLATPGVFQTFRARPALGRLIEEQDVVPGNEHVVVTSHRYWASNLRADTGVIGTPIQVDGVQHTIIGVLPEGFGLPELEFVDMWIPLWPERFTFRDWKGLLSFARLADGVSLEAARQEMSAIRDHLAAQYPGENGNWSVVVDSLHERTVRSVRTALLAFSVAVFLMLLIACANTANLLLSRAAGREAEFGLRMALGVGRLRLFRQVIVESSFYAVVGSLLGILLAFWAVDLFVKLAPAWFPRIEQVRLDQEVLLFSLLLGVGTTLLFGMAPAIQSMRLPLQDVIRGGQRSRGRQGGGLRRWLVVCEISLACLLAVGAGLFTRSFSKLLHWDAGFDPNNLSLISVFLPGGKYSTGEEVTAVVERSVQALSRVPGVASAGGGSAVPLRGGDGEQEFRIEGRRPSPDGVRPVVAWFDITPGYFETLRLPLVEGRFFSSSDRADSVPVAIINQTMARRYWPSESPIGARIRLTAHEETREVVGVVADVQPFRPDQAPEPQIYWPFAQSPRGAVMLVTRSSTGSPVPALVFQETLERIEPDLDLGQIFTMEELMADQRTNPAFNTSLADLFAAISVIIALIGVYGVMSFAVEQQYSEFGVRMALGARRADIAAMVLRDAVKLAGIGLGLGLLAALLLSGLLRSLLIGIEPTDPATYVMIGAGLALASLLASALPARKATRVDPQALLRCQ